MSSDTAPAGNPAGNNFDPSRVEFVSSSDGGATFGGFTPVSDPDNFGPERDSKPKLVVAQGTSDGRVPGGEVSIVWQDKGTESQANPPQTVVWTSRNDGTVDPTTGIVVGPVAQTFTSNGGPITDAIDPGNSQPHIPQKSDFPITVNISDSRFLSLTDLNVRVDVTNAAINELSFVLMPPTGSGLQPLTLMENQTNAAGTSNQFVGNTGANLGTTPSGVRIGTIFDDQATRDIRDINPFAAPARGAAAPFAGHFRPEDGSLSQYNGATAAQLSGVWTLEVTDFRNSGNPPPPSFVADWSLDFTANQTAGQNVDVNTAFLNIANPPNGSNEPIDASPVIASDNTLGAFSQFQGRLYVAYVDRTNVTNNPADNSDILLSFSDDNGLSWSFPTLVNDDDSLLDGYTESDPTGEGGIITGRAQFQPQVAVDQTTGTLVMSWLDTRDDASRSRTAYYLTDSIDGGETFSKDVYANPAKTAVDAITGKTVAVEPQLDNFTSTASSSSNVNLGTGRQQGLAVADGMVYPVWSSNLNLKDASATRDPVTDIRINPTVIPVGPRIVSSTMGPVGEAGDTLNGQRAADGAPEASAFIVTFDRPIDPSTFTTSDVQVFFRDTTPNNTSGGLVPVIAVTPLDLGDFGPAGANGATTFRVDFAPRAAVGTYSYTVGPSISDRVRSATLKVIPSGPSQQFGPVPSQTNLPIPSDNPTGNPNGDTGGPFSPATFSSIVVAGVPANQVISDVNVTIDVTHTFAPDLLITLIAPDGTQIVLSNRNGTGENPSRQAYINTTFDDQATTPIGFGVEPFSGSFQPDGTLSLLNGKAANGTWRLKIQDLAAVDVGRLVGWSLQIQTGTLSTAASSGNLMDQNGDADSGEFPTSGSSSSYDVYADPRPVNGVTLDPSDPTGNTFRILAPFDQDTLPLIVPGPHVVSTHAPDLTGTTLVSAQGSQANAAIPDGGTLNSTIVVGGLNGRVLTGLKVNVSIAHPRDNDLILTLIAPDGTQILLSNRRGGTGANYTNTTFDDAAGTAISAASAPFSGSFRPEVPLAGLVGKLAEGTWTLRVRDALGNSLSGTLLGWSLALSTDNATTSDNLVLDNSVSSLDVTFDRDMDPATFTPADVLRIMGPDGSVIRPYTFPSTNPAQTVPVASGSPLVSNLLVDDDGTFLLSDLTVTLDISAAKDANLRLVLVAPDGTQVTLANAVGGTTGANFTGTTFDDAALTSINSGTAPFSGTFRPAQALGTLDGKQLKGIWKLEVFNSSATTTATLNSWSLTATPAVTVTPNPEGTDPNPDFPRTFRVSFPTQQLSGTYTIDLAASIQSENGDAVDKDLNAGVDLLKGVSSGGSTPIVYPATSVPDAIPDGKTIDSSLTVGDDFVIQDASVTLNITHPNDPDLQAVLITPDGTRVILFSNLAATGNHQNFTNTLFNDNAPTPIQSAGSPYFSTTGFKPQQSLLTALRGKLSAGTYTLEVTDSVTNGLTGTLNSWSLTLTKPLPQSGLGSPVADQTTVSFRIFSMDPTSTLSGSTWTAVGPAAIGSSNGFRSAPGSSGRIGGLAVDPSDPSGNTVYVGGASGGVWKTTNFLDPLGPTYVPLTDFGPTFGINIGGIAVFGRNNDTNQSIIYAATGEGDTGSTGVGFLRSMDGGATWTLLDSTDNTVPFASRNHAFASNGGITSFKIAVDPKTTTSGGVIVYAAVSGNNGGIWMSTDSGDHWSNVLPGQATDLVLDPGSATGVSGGNLQILYASLRGVGVFQSTNQGRSWNLMTGGVGDPLIIDANRPAVTPVAVTAPPGTPNGAKGRIVLAKPALTGNPAEDLNYEGWLYAAVATPDSHLDGLYLTKDFGQNWTKLRIATLPPANGVVRAIATNDTSAKNPNYDVGGGPAGTGLPAQGNYDLSLGIDPTNPNIVYLGGTADGQPTGFLRIDASLVYDAHNLDAYSSTQPDGSQLLLNSTGRWSSTTTPRRPRSSRPTAA